jgi:hypothetical protein
VTIAADAAGGSIGWEATTTVGEAPPRTDDSGEEPAVYVIRSRPKASRGAALTTASIPARMNPWSGSARPSPWADFVSRSRCLVTANGCPSTILSVSKTPSPVVIPWSSGDTAAVVGPSSSPPFTQMIISAPARRYSSPDTIRRRAETPSLSCAQDRLRFLLAPDARFGAARTWLSW